MAGIGLNPVAMQAAPAAASPPQDPSGDGGFDGLMRISLERRDAQPATQEQQVRKLANQLVSVALIKPLLAQARQSPFRSELFHGGHGEQVFSEHLDTVIADRVAMRSNFDVADAIYRHLTGQRTIAGAATGAAVDQHG